MVLLVRAWILLSALLVGSGWVLSAAHQLNRAGYLGVFAVALAGIWWRTSQSPLPPADIWMQTRRKLSRRFRRPLPALFLVLALVALAAGVLYCPYNSDSDTYRIPRVFHWLWQEQWHWIHTEDIRMNMAATGFEWLAAPIMLFTGNDWCVFLINWISYLLLPGLVFSVFTRLGVRPRVAWWWMWLLATGWCYAWQAQTTTNDSFAAIYALAAVDFALRARLSHRPGDWWLALLAAALLTGAKQTNIPLAIVPLIALWPQRRMVLARPVSTLLVLAVCLLISVVPICLLNLSHTGDWMGGMAKDPYFATCQLPSPFWGVIGNVFSVTAQNLKPPVFPLAAAWNSAMQRFLQTPLGGHFKSFENFGALDHAASADTAGIGVFICLLALLAVGWAARLSSTRPASPAAAPDVLIRLLRLAPWLALIIFMAKVGAAKNARQLAPYYALLFPLLLVARGQILVVRHVWWRRLVITAAVATVVMIATSRLCPLFPAKTIFGWLHEKYPRSQALDHLLVSFSCHQLAEIERHAFETELPSNEKVIGYYSSLRGLAEPGHWEPFGIRRVERIATDDSPEWIHSRGIHYLMLDGERLALAGQPLEGWLRKYDAEIIDHLVLVTQYGDPTITLYLVRLRQSAAK